MAAVDMPVEATAAGGRGAAEVRTALVERVAAAMAVAAMAVAGMVRQVVATLAVRPAAPGEAATALAMRVACVVVGVEAPPGAVVLVMAKAATRVAAQEVQRGADRAAATAEALVAVVSKDLARAVAVARAVEGMAWEVEEGTADLVAAVKAAAAEEPSTAGRGDVAPMAAPTQRRATR